MPEFVNGKATMAGNTEPTGSMGSLPADPNTNQNNNKDVPLVFLREAEIFGNRRPDRSEWIQHVELYRALGQRIDASHISGLQRVRGMWRIYLDNLNDKVKLMAEGVPLRGKNIPVLNTNPDRLDGELTTKVRVKNVPLSADDSVIKRVITLTGADVISTFREKLRVDGKLTNCETGDRIIIVKTSSLKEPLPNFMTFGNFTGRVYHLGQQKHNGNRPLKCSKCLQDGHIFSSCENEWVCTICKQEGHKRADCPGVREKQIDSRETDDSESESSEDDSETEQSATPVNVKIKSPVKSESSAKSVVKAKVNRQQSIERFVTPAKSVANNNKPDRSPPTPAEELHDQLNSSQKKRKKRRKNNNN